MIKKIGMLALAVALMSVPAFAAVQNVRVSGDIDAKGIYQSDFDLKTESASAGTTSNADDEGFFLSTARVRIDADLTDNASATVRLLNQRKWDTDSGTAGDVELNLGYVTLKELLYSPLTLTIGRQDITVGRGFIVGAGLLQDPNTVFGTTNGQQYSAYNSYDAIKAVLDYSPLTVTALAIKVNETGTTQDDNDIYGINLGYKPGTLDSEIEAYWFLKRDESFASTLGLTGGGAGTRTYETNEVYTIGVRGSVVPTEGLTLLGELAYQAGEVSDQTGGGPAGLSDTLDRDRKAWAANLEGSYDFSNVTYAPKLGLGWTFYSGEESGNGGDLEAWDSMTRGLFFTAIHDFLAGSQSTSTASLYTTVDPNDTAATTNSHIFYVDGSLKPLDDLSVSLRYASIRFDEAPVAGRAKRAGDEVDVQLTYHYTEDVHLGLLAGWFVPGKYYDGQTTASSRSTDTASIVAGSVSVAF